MYQLFDIYEASFELDNQLSLIKCDMLNELGLYLELREEAIIFLKRYTSLRRTDYFLY